MSIFTSDKKLGFGTMRLPLLDASKETSIDIEQACKMVDHFIEQGFTYFDTAWMYHGFESENAVKKILVDRYPREAYTLATKFHVGFVKSSEEKETVFETQLKKTGVSYFDYYLIHDIERGNYAKYMEYDAFNWALDKKAKGLIKHLGFSFHSDAELLDQVLTEHPEMEFVQLQINYLDWESENIQSRLCYEVACKHNVPVVVTLNSFITDTEEDTGLINTPYVAEELEVVEPSEDASAKAETAVVNIPKNDNTEQSDALPVEFSVITDSFSTYVIEFSFSNIKYSISGNSFSVKDVLKEMNITDPDAVNAVIKAESPDAVIHCAS